MQWFGKRKLHSLQHKHYFGRHATRLFQENRYVTAQTEEREREGEREYKDEEREELASSKIRLTRHPQAVKLCTAPVEPSNVSGFDDSAIIDKYDLTISGCHSNSTPSTGSLLI